MRSTRIGVIDIGSNTVRLLVADVAADRELVEVDTRRAYLGTGGGDRPDGIAPDSDGRANDPDRVRLRSARSRGGS